MDRGLWRAVLVLALVGAACFGGAACSGGATGPNGVDGRAEVTAIGTAPLSATILSIDGTYGAQCTSRSGSWSVLLGDGGAMHNPALSVVTNNATCALAITAINADYTYTASPSLALGTSYQGSASQFTGPDGGGVSFYANAEVSSTSFASNFTITVLYSSNSSLLTGSLATGYASIITSTLVSTDAGATAPNYTLSLTGDGGAFAVTVSDMSSVSSVSGTVSLVPGSTTGDGYYVDQGTLGSSPTFPTVDSAYASATKTTISGSGTVDVQASAFGLTGVTIGSSVMRTIVVQHGGDSGTHTYQLFAFTFTCGGACGACPSGQSSKADSSGHDAGNICCTSSDSGTGTLNCNGTCVDTQVDPSNCGACGTVCPATKPACSGGSCYAPCPTGSTLCSGICVDTVTDNGNCGACGTVCSAPTFCASGACTPANGTYEFVGAGGWALDDNEGASGAVPDSWAYVGTDEQWIVTLVSGNQYKIISASASGQALTMSSTPNTTLAALSGFSSGNNNQLWVFQPTGSGSYYVINVATGMALDNYGGGLGCQAAQWVWGDDNPHQEWTLTPVASIASGPIADGVYSLSAASATGQTINDPGGATGQTPTSYPYSGVDQQWAVTWVGGGYKIINVASGWALTGTSSGNTNLPAMNAWGNSYQLWAFWPTGSGSYYIFNVGAANGDQGLDNNGGAENATLNQWGVTSTNTNQQWSLTTEGTLNSGLVASYLFNETSGTTAHDSSGNNNTATLTGGATFAAGLDANTATLDGSSGYVALPGGIMNGWTAFSVSAWVNITSEPSWSTIFTFGSGTVDYMYLTPASSNSNTDFAITTAGNGGETRVSASGPIALATWQHVVVTQSGTTVTIYRNGSSSNGTETLNPSSLGSMTDEWLGRHPVGGHPYFNGQMDNVRIYNRALTSTEVTELYTVK